MTFLAGFPSTIVEIGNPRGRIALYLDESDAIDMALHYGPSDAAYDELMKAVEQAYPETKPFVAPNPCIHTPSRCNGGGYDGCACGRYP